MINRDIATHRARSWRSRDLAVLFLGFLFSLVSVAVCSDEPLRLNPPGSAPPLGSREGYLLLELEAGGTAPSLRFALIRSFDQGYPQHDKPLQARGPQQLLALKGYQKGYYVLALPAGLYQVTRVEAPYFDFPFRLGTDGDPLWRFRIEAQKTNYIGQLVIHGERTSKAVDIKLINRLAAGMQEIQQSLRSLPGQPPLVSGSGTRDGFLSALRDQKP